VLSELRVENLLLIGRAELRLAPGLNVLTGETGAGKTVLAHALDLLLGGRARPGLVRPGTPEAYVEGVFEVGDDDLVLARRVTAEGRTRAYVGGRAASVGDLRAAADGLLAFYGQHEHRRLTLASAQLDVLDAFAGPEQADRRAACAAAHAAARAAEADRDELRERAGARERELDLVAYELREIDELDPTAADERELLAERERLRHLEVLRGAALAGAEAIAPGADDTPGVAALLATAERSFDAAAGVDDHLDALAERLRALRVEAEDLAAELRRYEDCVEAPPGRLEEVDDRLAAYSRLTRKHGGSVGAVLAHAERCRVRRDELEHADEALADAEEALRAARAELADHAGALRAARRAAAPELGAALRTRLAELAMEGATFEIEVADRDEPGPAGADAVDFLIATNPGVPAGPVRDIASGGELSRVMLGLLSVAHADTGRTLVFDEVDAGVGGHTARAVGKHLRALAEGRQVLCITHLPQIAALAERHFRIAKDTSTAPARTTVAALRRDELLGELARMLGADEDDVTARRHARELLNAA
jgi:DNA repair protein RecN (Recombination protein N)